MSKGNPSLRCQYRLNLRSQHPKLLKRLFGLLAGLLIGWVVSIWLSLWIASSSPVDAVLVLGGSIQREIAAAQLANGSPTTPILISQGSSDPCIRSVFQQAHAPVDQVWLEKCARSTFDNVCFSLPTLRSWKVHHVKLITSESHLPRAVWLAQIVLGAHRIWVEPAIVAEPGVPGNREFGWKTGLDVARSLVWAGMSQVYSPRCSNMVRLNEVDLTAWARQGFSCERRGIPRI